MTSIQEQHASSRHTRTRNTVLAAFGIVALFLGFGAWAISSPIGSSPDDDYHLGSIWCPRPIAESGCDFDVENGAITSVEVPQSIAEPQVCYATNSETDASCALDLSDTKTESSERFDNGSYPMGYYHFHHLFVGSDVERSALIMRLVNISIGIGAVSLIAALSTPRIRHVLIISAVIAWIPMGVYFIGSNNPSSWAISGCFIYGAGLAATVESTDSRRWPLTVLTALGAILAVSSRTDSAFYVFVITLAVWFLFPVNRERVPALVLSIIASTLGLVVLLTSGQAGNLTSSGGWPVTEGPLSGIFVRNIMSLPEHLASMWGLTWGPGWFDVPLLGWSTLSMIAMAGSIIITGAQGMHLRKALSALVMVGALCGIPVVSMTMRHVQPVYFYQGRYMLPLLAVFFLLWLIRRDSASFFTSRGQLFLIVIVSGVANSLALRRLIQRYALGVTSDYGIGLVNAKWWPWPISPDMFWALGSLAMAAGIAIVLSLSFHSVTSCAVPKTLLYDDLDTSPQHTEK